MIEEAYFAYKNITRRKHSNSELRKARNHLFELYLQLQKFPLSVRNKVPYNIRRHVGKLLSNCKKRGEIVVAENKNPKHTKSSRKIDSVMSLSYRLQKFQIRRQIIQTALEILEFPIKALTLPGTEWLFERDLLLSGKCEKIVGIESNKRLYEFARFNLPYHTSKIVFINKTDEEFFSMQDNEERFNLIWLDYMGPFTKNRLIVFEKALQNGFVENKTLFGATFLKGRENIYTQNIYKEVVDQKDEVLISLRSKAIPKLYSDIAEKYGYKAEVLSTVEYKEPSGAVHTAPMILILFFLQKGAKNDNNHCQ